MRLKTLIHKVEFLIPAAAFLMAFCPVSYLLLTASRLSRLLGEGLFIYPAGIAVFTLSAGWGGAHRFRRKPAPSLRRLLWLELGLTAAGFFSVIGIDALLFESLSVINLEAVLSGLAITAGTGFLSGMALTEFYCFCSAPRREGPDLRLIKFSAYLACGCASLLCTTLFFPAMGLFKTSVLVSFINLLLVISLLLIQKQDGRPVKRLWIWGLSVLTGFFIAFAVYADKTENAILQKAYLGHRPAMLLAKEQEPSQQILLYMTRKDGWPILETQREILAKPYKYFLFGLKNGSRQFFLPFESKADPQHAFLLDPYATLLPGIGNILILNGGDGLSARQAVQYACVKNITIVGSSRPWMNLAAGNVYLRRLTQNAFEDPRVKVYIMDPFQWVLRDRMHYDLIVVNTPNEPASLAKARMFSVQFFQDLKHLLSEHGTIVITSGSLSSPLRLSIQARTARQAGLAPLIGSYPGMEDTWGELEQLILFSSEKARAAFMDDYKKKYHRQITYGRKELAKFGMLKYSMTAPGAEPLSFYDPLLSRLPVKTQLQLFKENYVEP